MSKLVGLEVAKLLQKRGFDKPTENAFLIRTDGTVTESNDWVGDETDDEVLFRPTQDDAIAFLEGKGMFLPLMPEMYVDGINWNWQVLWYLPKEEWKYTEIDTENGREKVPTHITDGTGWYGDNGEFPTRHQALEAALHMGLMKLDPLCMNNSCDKLAKAYSISMNEMLTRIKPFSNELGEWSFRDLTMEQMQIIVTKLGNPFNAGLEESKKEN